MVSIREYLDANGQSPFGQWFEGLDATVAARVTTALVRIGLGNFSNAKSVGSGVHEWRLDHGPGYRIYFGMDGAELVILLAGGSKRRQGRDIAAAHANWADYRRRKGKEG